VSVVLVCRTQLIRTPSWLDTLTALTQPALCALANLTDPTALSSEPSVPLALSALCLMAVTARRPCPPGVSRLVMAQPDPSLRVAGSATAHDGVGKLKVSVAQVGRPGSDPATQLLVSTDLPHNKAFVEFRSVSFRDVVKCRFCADEITDTNR
jgi:hypothetical protein